MFKRIKKFVADYKKYREFVIDDRAFNVEAYRAEGYSVGQAKVLAIWDEIMLPFTIIKQATCKHNFEGESSFGPDNGYESNYCTKCGFSFSVTWY